MKNNFLLFITMNKRKFSVDYVNTLYDYVSSEKNNIILNENKEEYLIKLGFSEDILNVISGRNEESNINLLKKFYHIIARISGIIYIENPHIEYIYNFLNKQGFDYDFINIFNKKKIKNENIIIKRPEYCDEHKFIETANILLQKPLLLKKSLDKLSNEERNKLIDCLKNEI